jgi:ABC-2 type transport system permease protein
MQGIVPLIFLLFLVPGVIHGYVAGTFRSTRDVIKGMSESMSTMGYYMVMAFFAAQFFNGGLDAYRFLSLRAMQLQGSGLLEQLNLTDRVVAPLFGSVAILLLIQPPFISMRLFAEEKRARTFELLLTAPVRPWEIVAGKYLAAMAVMGLSLLVVALFPLALSFVARGGQGGAAVEWQTVGTGLLGLLLLSAAATALGMFFSTLTESVLVAGLVSLIVLLTLWVATIFTVGVEGPLRELASALSASEHLGPFLQGRIELKDVAYYLSIAALGLFLSDRVLEGHRWA